MNAKRTLHIDPTRIPRSYRDYLERLAERGELVDIEDEVDWNLEIGAILRHACETEAPFPRFNKIRDAAGFRACEMGPTASAVPGKKWQRLALLLGLPEDATLMEMQDAFLEAEQRPPHPPIMVDPAVAPCKQNKWFGEDIDLTKLPAPILHDGDGGRYLQTAGAIVVRTPPGTPVPPDHYTYDPYSWTNWSFSRGMISSNCPNQCSSEPLTPEERLNWVFRDGMFYSKKYTSGLWLPFQHNGLIYTLWQELQEDCPFVIALGVPPVAALQLSSAPPAWHDEYQYASSVLGEGLEMVRAETCDILVPANCEIIIEGKVSKNLTVVEGPFGEFPGYLSNAASLKPIAEITCITFRDNAILPICIPGIPVDSTLMLGGFCLSTTARHLFHQHHLPVIDCFIPFGASSHWLVIRIAENWHQQMGGSVQQLADTIAQVYWEAHVGKTTAKLMLVDHHVSPEDADSVLKAFIDHNDPLHGTFHYPQYDSDGTGLQIYVSVATKLRGRGGLVIYSCLKTQEEHCQAAPLDDSAGEDFMAEHALPQSYLPILDYARPFGPRANWMVVRVRNDWHQQTGDTVGTFMDEIARVFWSLFDHRRMAKLFVLGQDIPPHQLSKVIWGFATRNNPVQGLFFYPHPEAGAVTLQQCQEMARTQPDHLGAGSMVIYNCLQIQEQVNQPLEQVLSFETNYPYPLQKKILDKWEEWGF